MSETIPAASGGRLTGTLSGQFIEACDCQSLCPCWADDDPDDDHCTGLVAWDIREGRLEGDVDGCLDAVDVSNARVVNLATHSGRRRNPSDERHSLLFIDVDDVTGDRDTAWRFLEKAFSEPAGGPLADLASVMGAVQEISAARISISGPDRPPQGDEDWSVQVRATQGGDGSAEDAGALEATGHVLAFDQPAADGTGAAGQVADDHQGGEESSPVPLEPMTLSNTALHKEMAAVGPVTAMRATRFRVNVSALAGGHLDATGRSAMTGTFSYPRHARGGPSTGTA